ncbi:MAG: biopolymer transporter ExbD [Hyphomicrobiaceae bacterium]
MGMHVGAGSGGTSRRGRRKKHAPIAEINVTPFVDVMLVLLIVFMVAAPLLVTGVPIELPRVTGQPLSTSKAEPFTITVTTNGEVFLGDQDGSADLVGLPDKLKAIAQTKKDKVRVLFRGDRELPGYEAVVTVLAALKESGMTDVQFATVPMEATQP